ncbi:3D domain-containing protein [Ornithinibacillus xuwenensis]|uniref:3D domain-containing protein n=1 Tax=Ornithinibacillus xuwenensis TaxID=3144668 RepID=A0ABU9XC14_9BACI
MAGIMLISLMYPMYMQPIVLEAPETMIAEETIELEKYMITAYTAGPESTGKSPGDAGYGITVSGEYVQEGVTAACPKEISLYTVVEIEGLGKRICHDRGGAIKGNRIDDYMPYVEDALEFRVQELEVEIME